jgi:hypothetical protein
LWIDNDQRLQSAFAEASSPMQMKAMAEVLLIETQTYQDSGIQGLWLTDVVNAYISDVNWREIYENINEE